MTLPLRRPTISRRLAAAPVLLALAAALGTYGLGAPAGASVGPGPAHLAQGHGMSKRAAPFQPRDLPPTPTMKTACTSATAQVCDQAALADINAAHQAEGLSPLVLPSRYNSLSIVSQLVAVTNAERVSRGLPALAGPRRAFNLLAIQGAARLQDPSGPSGTTWVSNLATGFRTPLQADYEWMYDDGVGGPNLDCTPTNQANCWGHRDNILAPWGGLIGAAARDGTSAEQEIFAELMVERH